MQRLIGEILQDQTHLTQASLELAVKDSIEKGVPIGKVLVTNQVIEPEQLDKALATQLNLPYVSNNEIKIDYNQTTHCLEEEFIEMLFIDEGDTIYLAEPTSLKIKKIKSLYSNSEQLKFKVVSKFSVLYNIHICFRDHLSDTSVNSLAKAYPDYSAAKVMIAPQWWLFYAFISVGLLLFFTFTWEFLLLTNILITLFLLFSFFFKFLLAYLGSHTSVEHKIQASETDSLADKELPIYTILVPMYKEPEVLPIIVQSFRELDYPKEKLDIKFVLEEDDKQTQLKAKELNLERDMEVIVVPHSMPKTKPKACNYALQFAKGEYLTIYDAEDKPEKDQLKKAFAVFKKSPANTAVVQARLNYFNADENWITKMFTMEYSLWFDFYLPALERLNVPIPLGGTSNHFKTDILKKVGGWDPFNVTEDADLGIRFSQHNYIVRVVNSTTFEEANTHFYNWIRQRSRWIKGYMQTYLVHMRAPLKLYKKIGFKAFMSFQFFIAGTFLTALITPALYGVFFYWLINQTDFFDPVFIEPLMYISIFNLLLGNAFYVYIQMIGIFKRKLYMLVPWALTTPIYWLMLSMASYKAVWQLFTNPFYWEKTVHGLSSYTKKMVEDASKS